MIAPIISHLLLVNWEIHPLTVSFTVEPDLIVIITPSIFLDKATASVTVREDGVSKITMSNLSLTSLQNSSVNSQHSNRDSVKGDNLSASRNSFSLEDMCL